VLSLKKGTDNFTFMGGDEICLQTGCQTFMLHNRDQLHVYTLSHVYKTAPDFKPLNL